MANIIDHTNKPTCSHCGGKHWNDQCTVTSTKKKAFLVGLETAPYSSEEYDIVTTFLSRNTFHECLHLLNSVSAVFVSQADSNHVKDWCHGRVEVIVIGEEPAPAKPSVSATQTKGEVSLCKVATHISVVVPRNLAPALWAEVDRLWVAEPKTDSVMDAYADILIHLAHVLSPVTFKGSVELTAEQGIEVCRGIVALRKNALGHNVRTSSLSDLWDLDLAIREALLAQPYEPTDGELEPSTHY